MFRAVVVLLFCLCATFARPAAADPPGPRAANDKVEWKDGQWPRVTPWEAAGTLALTAFSLYIERAAPGVDGEGLTVEVPLLDPGARYLLRGRSSKVQNVFGELSDKGFRMMAFFPYVVDVGVAAIGVHRNLDVAGQLALIDLQALTFSGFTQLIASRFSGRARPYREDCHPESKGTITRDCLGPDNRSFYSGHAAAAFTSAGLTCVHHEHLPLFGGGAVERWACVWALSVATFTGVARIVGDAHYASDVLFGAGVGWFYGYVMPKLLHFKAGKPVPKERKAGELQWMPSFNALDGGGVLSVGAAF